MVSKIVSLICAQAILFQVAFGQAIIGSSYVDNNVIIGNSGLNLGGNSLNIGGYGNLGYNNLGLGSTLGIGSNIGVLGSGIGLADLSVVSSGPLIVTSISPIGPTGLAVASENVIQGTLNIAGTNPFLSAVAFEGALPTAGSGVATCGCGTGSVGIIGQGPASTLPLPIPSIPIGGIYY